MGEINVVPYIDVMLVLLIIFMITAPLLMQGVKVELPKAGAEPLDPELLKNSNPLVLSIDRGGRMYLNVGTDPKRPLDEVTVELGFSADGQIVFVARAGITTTLRVTFRRVSD